MAKETIPGDRRLQRRYPLELELEYKIIKDEKVVCACGSGRTGNMSSGGVLFHPGEGVLNGSNVELSVRWPAVLGDSPFLELCISGRLVRNDPHGVAIRMSRYRFEKLDKPREAFDALFTNAVIQ